MQHTSMGARTTSTLVMWRSKAKKIASVRIVLKSISMARYLGRAIAVSKTIGCERLS